MLALVAFASAISFFLSCVANTQHIHLAECVELVSEAASPLVNTKLAS